MKYIFLLVLFCKVIPVGSLTLKNAFFNNFDDII